MIRGCFTRQSAILEFSLFKIIVYCDTNNTELTKKFKSQTLGGKLKWAQEMLPLHYAKLYDSYKPLFTELFFENGLLRVRNDLIHYVFQFNEETKDKSSLDVRITKYEPSLNDIENIILRKTYSIEELDTTLRRFQDINVEFLGLWQKMVDDFVERGRGS